MIKKIVSSLVVLLIFSTGCNTENAFKSELLIGKWDVVSAVRAQAGTSKSTSTLDEVFFEFHENQTFNSNFPAELEADKTYHYKIKAPQMLHVEESELVFSIDELSDTSLVLSTEVLGYNFNMRLHRTE